MNNPDVEAESTAYISNIDATGELPLTVRRALVEILKSQLSDDRRELKFIAILGLMCARKAWPVWRSVFAAESRPMDLAEAAVTSIQKALSVPAVSPQDLLDLKTYLDNKLLLGEEYFPAVYTGFAFWAVARDVVAHGEKISVPGDSELQISPEEWDPCFFASLAITGGAKWERVERSDERREFWSWYLIKAIPEAFTVAVE